MKRRIAIAAIAAVSVLGLTAPSAFAAKAYTSKNCWAGNKANVQTTNWATSSTWQTYHVWVYRAPGNSAKVSMAFDGSTKWSGYGSAEFYINVPDHKVHTIGVGSAGFGCSYPQ